MELFERFPRLRATAPWVSLVRCPTPIELLEVEAPDGTSRCVLVKRDDLTGGPYGGNKPRKLEFILGEAVRRGATRVITAGAAGSHHALATTVYARGFGMSTTLVLFPQSLNGHVREVLLADHALGAELWWTPRMETVPLTLMRARVAHRAERSFFIAPGGSDPLGTLGYVNAGLELAAQLHSASTRRPLTVHAAAGTLGTVAGLAIGLKLGGVPAHIVATRITSRLVANEAALRRLVSRTTALLETAGAPANVLRGVTATIELRHDHIGPGYGRDTEAARAAAVAFGRAGLQLDPTYTAKSAAALLSAAVTDDPPIFLHTLSAVSPAVDVAASPSDLPPPFRVYVAG
jgi:1-aminocyclopropane-1-carboxylate deaminase/D-cysteine desulfhydrase-like pyridoxal-dependent ACC family enzyme